MSVIAEFSIPAEEFALAETLERRPELTFNIDRVVAHNTTQVVPFVRVKHGELEGLTEILEADPSVEEVELFGETDEECFYRLVWDDTAQVVGYMVNGHDATVQEAIATDGEWHLRVLFPERSGLSATGEYAEESEFTLDVKRIYGVDGIEQARYDLTEQQHDTLIEAAEKGYYDIPRDMSAQELAENLDISHQALSERVRRAHKNLIMSSLDVNEDEETDPLSQ
ncbi:bacterio-opsin activator domain-containing protein [Halococcus sediminicola]|uniref:bacterio-opsin activator domain-containing protein n=1 Tax=Halococcus sediminicola TaxID=1264579 RepID=UPI000679D251|nr:bacterio-opsin activator domain-containing protein [Halococcus sediminicola]